MLSWRRMAGGLLVWGGGGLVVEGGGLFREREWGLVWGGGRGFTTPACSPRLSPRPPCSSPCSSKLTPTNYFSFPSPPPPSPLPANSSSSSSAPPPPPAQGKKKLPFPPLLSSPPLATSALAFVCLKWHALLFLVARAAFLTLCVLV